MRLKKQIAEQLKQDIQEYYHMEDRIDEVKAKMTFNDNAEEEMKKEKNQIFFTKHLFIIFVILFSTILIGGSVGITCFINYQHFESEKSLYDQSRKEFDNYKYTNYLNYDIDKNSSFTFEKKYVFNIYEVKNEKNKVILYQYFSNYDNNFKIEFENKNYSKIVTNESDKKNTIGVLNDSSFSINAGDVVTGNVYLNNEFNRKITLNF